MGDQWDGDVHKITIELADRDEQEMSLLQKLEQVKKLEKMLQDKMAEAKKAIEHVKCATGSKDYIHEKLIIGKYITKLQDEVDMFCVMNNIDEKMFDKLLKQRQESVGHEKNPKKVKKLIAKPDSREERTAKNSSTDDKEDDHDLD